MLSGAILESLAAGVILDAPSIVLQGSSEVSQPAISPVVSAAISFVATLLFGGLAIAFAPDYVDRIVERINDNPLSTFGWGFLIYFGGIIAFVILAFILIITIVGILLLIPLVLVILVVAATANATGYIAIFGRIVDSQGQALLLGAATAGILTLVPLIGPVAGFVVSMLGIGAMFREFTE